VALLFLVLQSGKSGGLSLDFVVLVLILLLLFTLVYNFDNDLLYLILCCTVHNWPVLNSGGNVWLYLNWSRMNYSI